jgi:hypothetical protein
MADPALGEHERRQQHHAGHERADGQGRGPAGRLGVREAVDDQEQAGRGQDRPGPVQPRAAVRPLAVLHVDQRTGHRDGGEDQVHVQGPAPGRVLREETAQNEAHGTAPARYRPENAERPAPLGGITKRADQRAESGRRENRAENAL